MKKDDAIKLFKNLLEIRLEVGKYNIHHHIRCDDKSNVIIRDLEDGGYAIDVLSEEEYKKYGWVYGLVPLKYFDENSDLSKMPILDVLLATEKNWNYDLTKDPELHYS